jgi:ubiquinone/menaquinone biosynthesis C-methylase UbiE
MIRRDQSRNILGVNLLVCTVTQLPFRNTVFAGAMVTFCLKLISKPERALREIARVLIPSHRLGILANHPPHLPSKFLVAFFTKIVGILAKVNFNIDLAPKIKSFFKIVDDRFLHLHLVRRYVCEVPSSLENKRG